MESILAYIINIYKSKFINIKKMMNDANNRKKENSMELLINIKKT